MSILSLQVYAQTPLGADDVNTPNVTPLAPEIAAIANYMDNPVSYHSGVPSIEIPLLSLPGKVSVPVSISYHAGGIRVNDVASKVGLGWSLRCGGSISRTVRGRPDDSPNGYIDPEKTVSEFNALSAYGKQTFLDDNPDYDLESDIYSFNFAGYSGKFFLQQVNDGIVPVQNPTGDLKIEINNDPADNSGWIITDPYGIKYYFGISKDGTRVARNLAKDYHGFPNSSGANYPQSWHLMEIEDIYGETVQFQYDLESYGYFDITGQNRILNSPVGTGGVNYFKTQNVITNYRLSSISSSIGSITFDYVPRDDIGNTALKTVSLHDVNGGLMDEFELFYDYFESSSLHENPIGIGQGDFRFKRLKLTGLSRTIDPAANYDYSFDYNNLALPDRLSNSQDYWGYYNGRSNGSLYPSLSYFRNGELITYSGGADRSVDANYAKACILEKVTYPTGGYTVYDYEANTTSSLSPLIARSLGVYGLENIALEVIEDNTFDEWESEYYTLDPSEYPGGVEIVADFDDSSGCGDIEQFGCPWFEVELIRNGSPNDLVFSAGIDKTKYVFPVPEDVVQLKIRRKNVPLNGYDAPSLVVNGYVQSDSNIEVGGLRITNISKFTEQGVKVFSEDYAYSKFGDPTFSSGVVMNPPVFVIVNGFKYLDGCNYKSGDIINSNTIFSGINGGQNVLYTDVTIENSEQGGGKTEKEYMLQSNQYVHNHTSTTDYLVDVMPLPDRSHRNGLLKFERKYRRESGGAYTLVERTSLDYEFEEIGIENIASKIRNDGMCALSELVYLEYGSYINTSERYFIREKLVESDFSGSFVSNLTEYGYEAGHGGRNFPLTVTSSTSRDGITKIMDTDYPKDRPTSAMMDSLILQHRIAEPIEVRKILGESMGETLLSTRRTNYADFNGIVLPYQVMTKKGGAEPVPESSMETRIVYHSYDSYGNPREVSKKDGMRTSYVWGYNGQYPVAKIEGKGYSQLPGTLVSQIESETDALTLWNLLDSLRNHNYLQNSLVTTYTYDPLVGVTSVTDPKGNTREFVYDGLGRLKEVRDAEGSILSENDYNYGQ